MRKLFSLMATAFLPLGMAGVAKAAVLNWSGTSTILLAEFPAGEIKGGGVATVNGSAGLVPAHLGTLRLAGSRGQIQGSFTRIVTDPKAIANGVAALIYKGVGGLTATYGGISGGAASTGTGGGSVPLGGIVKICLLSTSCTKFISIALNQPTTVNGVPGTGTKGVGVGGLITVGGYSGIRFSLQAAPWTIKAATAIDQITTPPSGTNREWVTWVAKGWAHAPVSTTTSTAQPGGMLQLVTPNQIVTNLTLGSGLKMASFVVMAIHFIPEPGLLLLLGSAVAGLAFLGRRKMME